MSLPRCRRVYPRVCGGTASPLMTMPCPAGLSPRVRGNPCRARPCEARRGSIPACAGEPRPAARAGPGRKVYPRVCGGTGLKRTREELDKGLSPRVRGNLDVPLAQVGRRGSIPACAGEPPPPAGASWRARVYPRVCGGTSIAEIAASLKQGLSPRVRGNPKPPQHYTHRRGSIPACAGEPPAPFALPRRLRVYPRVCGGTRASGGRTCPAAGLSPRVRGNLQPSVVVRGASGSIPACAGEPRTIRRPTSGKRVYPRVCGGTISVGQCLVTVRGLSPRVRGNRP